MNFHSGSERQKENLKKKAGDLPGTFKKQKNKENTHHHLFYLVLRVNSLNTTAALSILEPLLVGAHCAESK